MSKRESERERGKSESGITLHECRWRKVLWLALSGITGGVCGCYRLTVCQSSPDLNFFLQERFGHMFNTCITATGEVPGPMHHRFAADICSTDEWVKRLGQPQGS